MKASKYWAPAALLLCLGSLPAWASPSLTTLYSFSYFNGISPLSGLIQGQDDGLLYGMTYTGGSDGYGNVFAMDTSGNNFEEVYPLNGNDGEDSASTVVQGADGNLYGVAQYGGGNNGGTIFEVATNGSGYLEMYDFGASAGDGTNPVGGLIQGSDGYLYGTTSAGGAGGDGTVFKIAPGSGTITYLHSFGASDLQEPEGTLLEDQDGSLYGTAFEGGAYGDGGVFRINLDGTGYTILHSFSYSDGDNPYAGLTEGGDGFIYGVTFGGGTTGDGAVFKIAPDGTGFQTLYSFAGGNSDGGFPQGGLLLANDENLYGTTINGGPNANGSIFTIGRGGSNYAVLHLFDGTDGSEPSGTLIQGAYGYLYGTTYEGGANSEGTVFSLNNGLSNTPTGLYALGGDAQVQLAWNNDLSETDPSAGYNVYRSTTSGGEGNTPYQTDIFSPQFTDNDVTQGTQYFYQVTAFTPNDTETPKSYEVTATPQMAIANTGGLSVSPSPIEATQTTTGTLTLQGTSAAATTVFLSSSDPSVTFANPDLTVPADQTSQNFTVYTANTGQAVTATITASDNGTDATAELQTTVPPVLHSFSAGLQMIAAPTNDSSVTLANLFAQKNPPMAVWTGSSYVVTPTAPANTIVPGQGYWAHPSSSISLYDLGTDTSTTSPIDVSLVAGWNMVGDPMNFAAPLGTLRIESGTQTYTLADANTAAVIGDSFYTYQPGDTAYETMAVSSNSSLAPFEGYWVYAFTPCTLVFPAAAG